MQGALNDVVSKCDGQVMTLEKDLRLLVEVLKEENKVLKERLEAMKDEMVLIKRAMAQGNISIPTQVNVAPKIDMPKPKAYTGGRNAKEIDNFLWSLEQYFKALGVEDTKKLDHAALYLADTAMVWWRR